MLNCQLITMAFWVKTDEKSPKLIAQATVLNERKWKKNKKHWRNFLFRTALSRIKWNENTNSSTLQWKKGGCFLIYTNTTIVLAVLLEITERQGKIHFYRLSFLRIMFKHLPLKHIIFVSFMHLCLFVFLSKFVFTFYTVYLYF